MVVRHKYKKEFEYILISELPKNQQEEFTKFMAFQTMPAIYDEINKTYLEGAVFSWDYENWLEWKCGRGVWD
jgi:hypothetical protein